ncbi:MULTISPECIES: sigma-70 family RNA polymerase sigma factor [unclassified Streptomyces]|uniref:sigma-70 family RNA polymerase sigma factor n=1 Tax=unclassified Streptomyces TaxID=2593676 RepID=UPI002DD869EC|nr:sigma-70 family RNA polymerase sigma factor [Streptomyces sp. NBC_01795]WSA90467.1 sigma-70 family RNA polymerase sigma factor [Streptomyces sp. NBC_01795]WSS45668.1 sigma-70 family RNA polymerase sigma factor [Streptomyces sp. NBC_01187]
MADRSPTAEAPGRTPGDDSTPEELLEQAKPYRNELLAHCYRMLGSVHDAEDLVQDTYLRAWRAGDKFEGRSSLRTWLYRIATNACLTAIEQRGRRPMPSGLGAPSDDPRSPVTEAPEVSWLEPIPDTMFTSEKPSDPAAVVVTRSSMRLALVAALQHLPARQRVVLLLRDVLKWRAAEVAELLGTSTASVNSALQRARAQLDQVAPVEEELAEPTDAASRELLDRYAAAFEKSDVSAIVDLFKEDAVWEMPPFEQWFRGRENIVRLITAQCPIGRDEGLMLPTSANGQPAFGLYSLQEDGTYRPFHIQVLTLHEGQVSHVGAFFGEELFEKFGLPTLVRAEEAKDAGRG